MRREVRVCTVTSKRMTVPVAVSLKTPEWTSFRIEDMSEPMLLRRMQLTPAHSATGKTRHFSGGERLPTPSELRIVRYSDDPGYYLFYCDSTGKELTDTYHDSLAGAFAQAEWEYSVKENEWETISAE